MLGCLVCEILMREMTNLLELALPCSTWCMFAVPPTNSLEVLRLSLVCSSLVRSFSNSPIRSLAGSFIHSFIHSLSSSSYLYLSLFSRIPNSHAIEYCQTITIHLPKASVGLLHVSV